MKKYCIFSDVHSNYNVLYALTQTQDFITADKRIFLGDALGCCPFFNETVDLLFNTDCIVLLGNHDMRAIFDIYNRNTTNNKENPHFTYIRQNLRPDLLQKLQSAPLSYSEIINGKSFYFTHYIWRKDNTITPRVKPITAQNIYRKFRTIKSDYIFYGHEHKESFFTYKNKTLVGVGSLGMKCPGNYIMLYINDDGSFNITRHRLPFDLQKLRDIAKHSNMPQCNDIISTYNFHE